MNRGKLKGRIVELYGSQRAFSDKIGLTEQSITAKLNGRSQFSQADIIKWCTALEIEKDEVADYFFTEGL